MGRIPRAVLLAFTLVLGLAVGARPDIVYLTNGQKVEGEVTDLGDSIRVRKTSGITVVYPKSKVLKIERRASAAGEYRKRRQAVEAYDAKGLLDLARWCDENDLKTEAEAVYREVLGIASPVHRAAKRRFAEFLDKSERLKEALALYEELGADVAARARSAQNRLERQRTIAFREAEEHLAAKEYREAVGTLVRVYGLTPSGGASDRSAFTEADVLAKLSEARKLLADTFATSRLTISECPTCQASGTVTCGACNGQGQVQREFITMSPTGGVRRYMKWVRCDGCRGGKKVRCTSCRGVSTDTEGLEGNLRNSVRLMADRAYSSIGSLVDRGIERMNAWVLKNPLLFGEGSPAYAKSRAMRDLIKAMPPSREDLVALKGAWKGADAEARGNFLACYGLEIGKLVAAMPQSALDPDRKTKPEALEAAERADASLLSAFPESHSGGAFRVAGVWKGGRAAEGGVPRLEIDIETAGPHSLRPFLWLPEAKAVHARLGVALNLKEMKRRADEYHYADVAKVAGLRAEGDRVELLGRLYYDDKPVPDWRFEVWAVSTRPDEEMEKAVALLSEKVTFRFEKTPLEAGLGMLGELTGAGIDLDVPKGLDLEVSASVKCTPLGRALGEMLQPLELHWVLSGGRVRVTAEVTPRERERAANVLKLLPPADVSAKE